MDFISDHGTINAPSTHPRWWSDRATLLGAGCILLGAFFAYHNSFSGPFLLDDTLFVVNNATIRHLWPLSPVLAPPPEILKTGNVSTNQVVNLSYAVNYALGGLEVWGYHAFNLLAHMLAGLLVFGIVRRTFHSSTLAAATASLWVMHPLTTEAVTYVAERNELLMGLFYLLTLYSFIRFTADKAGRWKWGLLSIVACFLGTASKQVMVTAPIMVFLYDRTFVSGTFRKAWQQHSRLYLGLFSSWLFMLYQMQALSANSVGASTGIPWWAYALTESRAVTNYLGLAFWPSPLVFDFGLTIFVTKFIEVAPYVLLVLVLVGFTVFALKRWPVLGFVGSWVFVILAPTSSVVPIAGQPFAEHRMYLPLLALVGLVAFTIHKWLGRRSIVIFFALAVGLGWTTVQRNNDYRSEIAFYGDMIQKRPANYYGHYNLARAYLNAGALPEAIAQYRAAIKLEPKVVRLYVSLGDALASADRPQEAAEQYKLALQLDPNLPDVYCSVGNMLFRSGELSDAVRAYKIALQINPGYVEIYFNLGVAQGQLGNLGDAIDSYEQALRHGVDSPAVRGNLGVALARSGRLSDAATQFQEALRQDPNDADSRRNLEIVLRKLGRSNN